MRFITKLMYKKNWRKEILDRWQIKYLLDTQAITKDILWATRCSKTKGCQKGYPQDMYRSMVNIYFYSFVEKHNFRFGVLSDKYGIHLDSEQLPYYDIHPSKLSQSKKVSLGKTVRKKVLAAGFSTIIFYNNSPLMSIPYFEILFYSQLSIFYTTKLGGMNDL